LYAVQAIKDSSMAYRIRKILNKAEKDDHVLVICGTGHMAYGCGVPERIWKQDIKIKH
jgi:uncharacterized iron-regulated protein